MCANTRTVFGCLIACSRTQALRSKHRRIATGVASRELWSRVTIVDSPRFPSVCRITLQNPLSTLNEPSFLSHPERRTITESFKLMRVVCFEGVVYEHAG